MGWLARVFASAIARRLAYVLVAATLAWCGIGCASAEDFGTQGAAYSACMSQTAAYLASLGRGANDRNPECNVEQGSHAYRGQFETRDCSSCDWYRAYYGYFAWSKGCDQEPDYTGSGPWGTYVGTARNGSIGCRNGCDGVWFGNSDDTMTWNATGAICPKDPEKTCDAMTVGYVWNGYLACVSRRRMKSVRKVRCLTVRAGVRRISVPKACCFRLTAHAHRRRTIALLVRSGRPAAHVSPAMVNALLVKCVVPMARVKRMVMAMASLTSRGRATRASFLAVIAAIRRRVVAVTRSCAVRRGFNGALIATHAAT